jgi:hypothetical protein
MSDKRADSDLSHLTSSVAVIANIESDVRFGIFVGLEHS